MKCIYWNTKNLDVFHSIIEIIKEQCPDILFLSETSDSAINNHFDLLQKLQYEYFLNPGCKRIRILKKKNYKVVLGKQSTYYTTLKDKEKDLNIISVHLPSQMYQSMDALKSYLRDFRGEIDEEIGSSLKENILIIGDFNVNPFEKPMIDFDGFVSSPYFSAGCI